MIKKLLAALFLSLLVIGIACWPVTSRVGVNYVVTTQGLTLAEKVVHFLSRHWQTQRLAASVTGSARSSEEKIERILAWVNDHVQPVPPKFPVVDDHPLHILLRGYGSADQRTEAFTLIASYADLPTATVFTRPKGADRPLILALVRWEKSLYPVDVEHNLLFRTASADLADLEDLSEHPEWIKVAAGDLQIDGIPYAAYWQDARSLEPSFERMKLQRPWARVQAEAEKAFRLGFQREK